MSQNSFLGAMQTTLIGNVICLTKYEIDANTKGGSIWVQTPNSGINQDILGDELIKVKMPFEIFAQQKAKVDAGELKFPAQMELLVQVSVGSQNKAALNLVSMRPYLDDSKPEPNPASKPGAINPAASTAAKP